MCGSRKFQKMLLTSLPAPETANTKPSRERIQANRLDLTHNPPVFEGAGRYSNPILQAWGRGWILAGIDTIHFSTREVHACAAQECGGMSLNIMIHSLTCTESCMRSLAAQQYAPEMLFTGAFEWARSQSTDVYCCPGGAFLRM